MPFEQLFPRSFSPIAVRDHAPAQPGVYGLTNASSWLFISETENIRESLMNHLRDSNSASGAQRPTGFVYEVCDRTRSQSRRTQLVREYQPVNQPQSTSR